MHAEAGDGRWVDLHDLRGGRPAAVVAGAWLVRDRGPALDCPASLWMGMTAPF
jgi:hypothetical protein